VKPAAGPLLHGSLVHLFPEVLDLADRPGIRVGMARCQRSAGAVDRDQGRGESVHRDAPETLAELGRGGQPRDQLGNIFDSSVGVQLDRTVSSRIERVGEGVIQPGHRGGGGVIDRGPAAGGSDVEHEHKRVLRIFELNIDRHVRGTRFDHLLTVAADAPIVKPAEHGNRGS